MQYFSNQQIGGGMSDIGKLYKSNRIYQHGFGAAPIIVQQGHGLGSVLQNFFQAVYPIIRSGFNSLGSEAKTAGKNILRDIATKPITSLIKEHGTEAISNLKNKITNEMKKNMSGKGVKKKSIKKQVKRLKHQSHLKAAPKRSRQNKKQKIQPRILDIFD
jgi:hypothetical protein